MRTSRYLEIDQVYSHLFGFCRSTNAEYFRVEDRCTVYFLLYPEQNLMFLPCSDTLIGDLRAKNNKKNVSYLYNSSLL